MRIVKLLVVLFAVLLLCGCSLARWTDQIGERVFSGGDPDSLAIQCMALGEAQIYFATQYVEDQETGVISKVADLEEPVAKFPCKAAAPRRDKDGGSRPSLEFDVQCPQDSVQWCVDEIRDGLWLKVHGYQKIPPGTRTLYATYVEAK